MSAAPPVYARTIAGAHSPAPAAARHSEHFLGLDLLRGIAALAVVLFHLAGRVDLPAFVSHGYLAVDFFFVLSGFVVARAYEARIADGRLSVGRFFVSRAIRLLPVIVLGTLVAAVIEIGRPGVTDQGQHLLDTALAFLSGSVLVPTAHVTTLEHALFPLNGPAWSLSLEAIASVALAIYARFCRSDLGLWVLLIVCAGTIIWGAHEHGDANMGALPGAFWFGLARLGWSFTVGMMLLRVRSRTPRTPFIVPLMALIGVLSMPDIGVVNEFFDDLCILIVFPVIVLIASTANLVGIGRKFSMIGGDLSYPMYGIHYPLVRVIANAGQKIPYLSDYRVFIVFAGAAGIVAVSACAFSFYDVPIRKLLTSRYNLRQRARPRVPIW